ncbi:ferrochelatase [Candidatus Chlamydia corallus]|uniref:ferrochelatase n=1 Tax=Candidatus Chlamydia corallus TaxID=2038470 RepID=UPI000C2F87C1|nr:ferrochelatase [Candidatus Chlamydia corallus]
MTSPAYLLANFGGPRHAEDLQEFLISLLTDRDVTGTFLPKLLHRNLFTFIAKKRISKVLPQYESLEDWSPIYSDTEILAKRLSEICRTPVIPFHRYLPSTHKNTLDALRSLNTRSITGIPLFPHFTYSVTGSIVRFFMKHLPETPISWIPQFGSDPKFVSVITSHIQDCLQKSRILEKECCFLFSVHGLPVRYISQGDPYSKQCYESFSAITANFKEAENFLCFQSKFGPGKWLSPSTAQLCKNIQTDKPNVIVVPFGFVSDHLETLYEIEKDYLPLLRSRGYQALRIPTIYGSPLWVSALAGIMKDNPTVAAQGLIKTGKKKNYVL